MQRLEKIKENIGGSKEGCYQSNVKMKMNKRSEIVNLHWKLFEINGCCDQVMLSSSRTKRRR